MSEGVPGSNDRAERANCPNRGHAIPNTGKIYAAPELPSLAVGTGSSVFGSSGGERFWSAVIVEVFLVNP